MKLLPLTLKKTWFAKIKSGTKREEYRTIKPYWIIRLMTWEKNFDDPLHDQKFFHDLTTAASHFPPFSGGSVAIATKGVDTVLAKYSASFKTFNAIDFTNGYGKKMPNFKIQCLGISIGNPKQGWADSYATSFVLKLGKKLPDQKIPKHLY